MDLSRDDNLMIKLTIICYELSVVILRFLTIFKNLFYLNPYTSNCLE